MPILYYAPIIHSIEDFGSLGPAIKASFPSQDAFDRHQEQVNAFWVLVEKCIEAAIPDPNGLIIYQDSMPVGDQKKAFALLDALVNQSPNHLLIKKLRNQGAMLEGTEDPALLCECAALYESMLAMKSPAAQYAREVNSLAKCNCSS